MDKVDFEAHVGLPITYEQFEAFKLLYHSGCFTDWPDFARKALLIAERLYLPGTECCLEEEKHRWEMLYRNHPSRCVREDVLEIYSFLYSLKLWHTPRGVFFRNECVNDCMIEILKGVDGGCILQRDEYAIELDIPALAALCAKLPDTVCHATGRTWKEEMKEAGCGKERKKKSRPCRINKKSCQSYMACHWIDC